jgi:hypothetical protein
MAAIIPMMTTTIITSISVMPIARRLLSVGLAGLPLALICSCTRHYDPPRTKPTSRRRCGVRCVLLSGGLPRSNPPTVEGILLTTRAIKRSRASGEGGEAALPRTDLREARNGARKPRSKLGCHIDGDLNRSTQHFV